MLKSIIFQLFDISPAFHHPAQMQPLSQQFYTLHWGEYWKQDKYKEKEALLTIMNLKDL